MTTGPDPQAERRRRTLRQLEQQLAIPMIMLGAGWLILLIQELVWGASRLNETLSLAIWCAFIVEFAVRFAIAPEKLAFLRTNWLGILALAAPALRVLWAFKLLPLGRSVILLRLATGANAA